MSVLIGQNKTVFSLSQLCTNMRFSTKWSEITSLFELGYLVAKRKLKEKLIYHRYHLDHDIEHKKCCHNKQKSKEQYFGKDCDMKKWQKPITAEVLRNMVKSDRWKSRRRHRREGLRQDKIAKSLIYHSRRLCTWEFNDSLSNGLNREGGIRKRKHRINQENNE